MLGLVVGASGCIGGLFNATLLFVVVVLLHLFHTDGDIVVFLVFFFFFFFFLFSCIVSGCFVLIFFLFHARP